MKKTPGAIFIKRNRAPRVQIQYVLDTDGAQQKEELPFVMGVMADLAGKPEGEVPSLEERDFLEIDQDNFKSRMRAMKPRVAFSVPNTLTEDGGNLQVDLTFESMDDFSPAAVAAKVDGVKELLAKRNDLARLVATLDGRSAAEEALAEILQDDDLKKAIAGNADALADE